MRRGALILLASLTLAAPAALLATRPRDALDAARAEAAAAERRQQALEAAAGKARGEAAVLRARREAAAASIDLAEARIDAAALDLARGRQLAGAAADRLAQARAPAASLVAGIVSMGRRPPLLVLADGGSIDQLVRLRSLLDAGLPVIRARSAALATEAREARARAAEAQQAATTLRAERQGLAQARSRFASLEREAERRAGALEGSAFLAADRVIAGDEQVGSLDRAASRDADARRSAALLARLDPLPSRPVGDDGKAVAPPFAFRLPGPFPVSEGMGAVSEIGVASRGVTLETPRGAALVAPAAGRVLFAGPYRKLDGLVILDHGSGWTTLIANVRPDVERGQTVAIGAPLGTALGPVGVELRDGQRLRSPALIARSSLSLSNGRATR